MYYFSAIDNSPLKNVAVVALARTQCSKHGHVVGCGRGVGPEDDVTIGIGVQPDEQCPVVELCTLGAGGKRELLHGHGRLHADL